MQARGFQSVEHMVERLGAGRPGLGLLSSFCMDRTMENFLYKKELPRGKKGDPFLLIIKAMASIPVTEDSLTREKNTKFIGS